LFWQIPPPSQVRAFVCVPFEHVAAWHTVDAGAKVDPQTLLLQVATRHGSPVGGH
jgi:hypothetical protein